MKKSLSIMAILFTVGSLAFISNVSAGRGQMGPGHTPGVSCRQQGTVDPKLHQQFMDESEGLRTALQEKRAAYFEMMRAESPDKATAQQLWSEMFDLQTQIRAKAAALGITPMGPGCEVGPPCDGMGPDGEGRPPCNGMGPRGCNCQKAQ